MLIKGTVSNIKNIDNPSLVDDIQTICFFAYAVIFDDNTLLGLKDQKFISDRIYNTFWNIEENEITINKAKEILDSCLSLLKKEKELKIDEFLIITKISKNKFALISDGSFRSSIDGTLVKDKVNIFDINDKNKCKKIFAMSNQKVATLMLSSGSYLDIIKSLPYYIYARHKVNSLATTTLISIASLSYISSQSQYMKEKADFNLSEKTFLESKLSLLEEENSVLQLQNSITEKTLNQYNSLTDYNSESSKKLIDINTEIIKNNKSDVELSDSIESKELVVSLKNEINSLKQEIESKDYKIQNILDSIKDSEHKISSADKALRNIGIKTSIRSSNFPNDIKEWYQKIKPTNTNSNIHEQEPKNTSLSVEKTKQQDVVNANNIISALEDKVNELKMKISSLEKDLEIANDKKANQDSKDTNIIKEQQQEISKINSALQVLHAKNQALGTCVNILEQQLTKIIVKYIEASKYSNQDITQDNCASELISDSLKSQCAVKQIIDGLEKT